MVKSINIYTHYKSINYGPIYEIKNKLWTNNIRNYCTLEDHPIQELQGGYTTVLDLLVSIV